MPALPLEEAGKYVAAAYVVFTVLLVVYVAIMAAKLSRIRDELGDLEQLLDEADRRDAATGAGPADESAPGAATPRPSATGGARRPATVERA
jgi:hypothetical protein